MTSAACSASPVALEILERCALCGSDRSFEVSRRGKEFRGEIVRACRGCGVFYLSPRLAEGQLELFYQQQFSACFRGGARPTAEGMAVRNEMARYRYARLRELGVITQHVTLLELGCGAGNFLEICAVGGARAFGVEPSEGYAAAARERGCLVEIGTYPAMRGPLEVYDAIAMFHVLEHLPDPREALLSLAGLMHAGSVLIVEVPELRRSLSPLWTANYFSRPHLFDFTKASLERLLASCGFSIDSVDYAPRPRRHHLLLVARRAPARQSQAPTSAVRLRTLLGRIRVQMALESVVRGALGRLSLGRPRER